MKIRIKGPSVRLRLSRSEVAQLVHDGIVEEETLFGTSTFKYAVRQTPSGSRLTAVFEQGTMILFVPRTLIRDWDTNDVVSIDEQMPVGESGSLYLLLEKDFKCLDHTTEDQSDNYLNPNQSC